MYEIPVDIPTVEAMLPRIPETWAVFNRQDMTALEDEALKALIGRGFVEVRFGLRLVIGEEKQTHVIQVEFCGDAGLPLALGNVIDKCLYNWHQQHPDVKIFPPVVATPDAQAHSQWRLSAMGVRLRGDLKAGNPKDREYAIDFLTRSQQHQMVMKACGKNPLASVDSHGRMVSHEIIPLVETPSGAAVRVHLENPNDIAKALAEVLANALAGQKAVTAPKEEEKQAKIASPKTGRPAVTRDAVEQYLSSHHEIFMVKPNDQRPTLNDWAKQIAEEISRFLRKKVSAGTIRNHLKGVWSFADCKRQGDKWVVRPQRKE